MTPATPKSRRWIVASIASLAILLLAGRMIAGWYVDYRWYEAFDATALWRARASNLLLLRSAAFVVATAFVFINLFAVQHSVKTVVLPRRVGNLEIGEEVPRRYLFGGVAIISVLFGALLALPHNDWISLELIRHGLPFGETDPYFQRDLAFWLYWLPLESTLHFWSFVTLLVVVLTVTFLYALTPSLRWENGRLYVSGHVRRHLFTLGGVLLLLLSWSYRLDGYELLSAGSGPLGTFSAIDHRVALPSSLVLSIVAVAAAMLVVWSGWTGQIRLAFFTITAVLLIALALRQIVPPLAERFVTPSDHDRREAPYRATGAAYTRRAYDVDRLTRASTTVPPATFGAAIRGTALWDASALARVLTRLRPAMTLNGSLGWDAQDGRVVAYAVAQPSVPGAVDSQAIWRLARVAADVADERGGVVERGDPESATAGVLFGILVHESADGYYVVDDSAGRVVGTPLRSFGARLAHAWHLQNPRLLREADAAAARILLRRNVRQRLQYLYPFFSQGTQVSPVALGDSLYWAVHLYATSERYPLSTPMYLGAERVRYLRHAAVAVVNAHTGRTVTIPDPFPDPVTATWLRRFPMLFAAPGSMDTALTRKLPPAVDGAVILTRAFALVGLRGEYLPPSRLPWNAGDDSLFTLATTTPYFDPSIHALALAIPVLDPNDQLRGLLTADNGAEHHVQWRPDSLRGSPRWATIVERLQRPSDTLQRLIREARPVHGTPRVIPASEGPIIVQTHYTTRPDGTAQVLYASMLYRDSVYEGLSIAEAAGLPSPDVALPPMTPENFRTRVETLYSQMREALQRGDWMRFGRAYEELGRLLRRGK